MSEERSGSILAVDFGNVNTRAVLIDLVDGAYRLVARGLTASTAGFPASDPRYGLVRAVEQITAATGRTLIAENGAVITPEGADRTGVDVLVTTASTGRTLRTVIMGLVGEMSIASALRAAAGTYVDIVETISLEDLRDEEALLNAIVVSRPDLIFITGGMEDGAEEPVLGLVRLARMALRLMRGGRKPAVLYAGNSALAPTVSELLEGMANLFIAPNIRPESDSEELEGAQVQLALAFNEQQANRSGLGALARLSRLGVLPTAQSYNLVTDYLGRSTGQNVLIVDVGSAVSIVSSVIDGRLNTAIRTDLGVGHSADTLVEQVGEDVIKAWLPFETAPNQIMHYALNKTLRPGTVPETLKGLYLEHALLRTAVHTMLRAAAPGQSANGARSRGSALPLGLLIGAGATLTQTGSAGMSALLLLDAVQPVGVVRLLADPYGLIAALGALALSHPEGVVQVMESNSLQPLGVAFCAEGQPALNRPALRIRIRRGEGRSKPEKLTVLGGQIGVVPLPIGTRATVEVSAGRGLSFGGRRRIKVTVEGGAQGLIFDARGRPLPVATTTRGRAAQFPLWLSQATGEPAHAVDESWLEVDPNEVMPAAPVLKGKARQRSEARKSAAAARGSRAGRAPRAAAPAATSDTSLKSLRDALEPPDLDRLDKPARGQSRRNDKRK